VLHRSHRVAGADVPDWVLRRLPRSRLQRGLAAAIDRLWPPARSAGTRDLVGVVTSVQRDSARATAAAVAARVSNHAASVMAQRLGGGAERALADAYVSSGSSADRAAYFEDVRRR
jgi:hypothetical protein